MSAATDAIRALVADYGYEYRDGTHWVACPWCPERLKKDQDGKRKLTVRTAGTAMVRPRGSSRPEPFDCAPDRAVWNCLAGETRVMTWEGLKEIRSLAGQRVRLLTSGSGSRWVDAPVESFGVQRLWKIVIRRNGVRKVIRATAEHRWILRGWKSPTGWVERTTETLKPGYQLKSVLPPRSSSIKPSPWGVAHGFTYGDGERTNRGGARVYCWEPKDAPMLTYYPLSKKLKVKKGELRGTLVTGLPLFFKERPSLGESPAYLYGWLAGYFAADGCVAEDGHPTLASASRDDLEFVRDLCIRIGVTTHGIKVQERIGYGPDPSNLYSLSFARSSLTRDFFILPHHRDRWAKNQKVKERLGWVVESVEPTGDVEEVFCAVVPGTHTFALEDNLLTGNCFRCRARGVDDFAWLVALSPVDAAAQAAAEAPEEVPPVGFASLMMDATDAERRAISWALDQRVAAGKADRNVYREAEAAGCGVVRGLGSRKKYRGRLIIPAVEPPVPGYESFGGGPWIGFVAWDARGKSDVPYLTPRKMPRDRIVMGVADAPLRGPGPVYLVEGSFDRLALFPYGWAFLGKDWQPGQLEVVAEQAQREGRDVIPCLDGDAPLENRALEARLRGLGVACPGRVELPTGVDPGKIGWGVLRYFVPRGQ